MIKVFAINQNGKIELTKEELQSLLDDAYWDGYRAHNTWTYSSPLTPYRWTLNSDRVTLNASSPDSATDHTDPDYGVGVNA